MRSFNPSVSPLQFLRIVASEYLAAYQLTEEEAAAWADSSQVWRDEAPSLPMGGDVIDISSHPRFDGSALYADEAFTEQLSAAAGSHTTASLPVRSA